MWVHINVAVDMRLVNPTGFNRRPKRDRGTGATLMGDRPNTKGEGQREEMKRTSAVVIALATVLAVTAANAGQMAVRDPGAR